MIQQGKHFYLGTLCDPCSDPEKCQAGRASLSCSDTEPDLGEMIKNECVHCVQMLTPDVKSSEHGCKLVF